MARMVLGVIFVLARYMVCCSFSSAAMVPAPAPQQDCSNELALLVPCLDYVDGTDKTPTSECCTGLASVVKSSPVCLCQLKDTSLANSGINATRALELPSKCKFKNLDPSQCNALLPGSPTPATGSPTSAISLAPSSGLPPEGSPSFGTFGPVPAPEAGVAGAGGVSGSPNSSPPAAASSASTLSPFLRIYLSVVALCAFL